MNCGYHYSGELDVHTGCEGGFELSRFPNVLAWLDRVKSQPKFIPQFR
jgi:hypothetical protein